MRERATPADTGALRIGRVRLITGRTAAIVPTALMVAIAPMARTAAIDPTARRPTIADTPRHARTVLLRVDIRRHVPIPHRAATEEAVAVITAVVAVVVVASTAVEVADTVVEAAVTTKQLS